MELESLKTKIKLLEYEKTKFLERHNTLLQEYKSLKEGKLTHILFRK